MNGEGHNTRDCDAIPIHEKDPREPEGGGSPKEWRNKVEGFGELAASNSKRS